jgi:hypothetical protein
MELNELIAENEELKSEVLFLRKRNLDLRQKSWYSVYEENLRLKQENEKKFSDLVKYERTIEQLRKELIQVGQIADKYYQDAVEIGKENQRLWSVIDSVKTFVKQFTK